MSRDLIIDFACLLALWWLLKPRQAGAGTADPCKGFYYTDDGIPVITICK